MSLNKHIVETKSEKKGIPPETVVGPIGSAKRNIIRKGGKGKYRKEGVAGAYLDDGSTSDILIALDHNDPNYDSEDEFNSEIYIPSDFNVDIGNSKLKLTEYKRMIEPLIKEYFLGGEIDEVISSIQEINAKEYSYEFVKRIINMSFDKSDRERELVSQLISQAYPNTLSTNMIGKGFERLFELVDEIEKDAPSAKDMLAKFLARAIVDEVLPPSFLSDAVICNLGGGIVDHAKRMLSREHGLTLLERGWGPGDGRPVEELKVVVDQLVLEYLSSGDLPEAIRCVKELNAPFFMHEVVKRAIVLVVDKDAETQRLISSLFTHLSQLGILSRVQTVKGFDKIHRILPDLLLDAPGAKSVVEGFVNSAKIDNILSKNYSPLCED
jgi:programmed cell death protein 4